MTTEREIQNAIIRWCALHDHMRVFRQNTGAAKLHGQHVTFGTPGQGDLRGIIAPLGRLVEIEVKKRGGRQSPKQKAYEAMAESMGAVYILARCVEDVWARLRDEFPDHAWRTPGEVI